ncbi:MAG: septum formation initiator family protein [Bacteroidetes bacterium]|nr:septum formation initiator family protein [Bacteroidota bacterium]
MRFLKLKYFSWIKNKFLLTSVIFILYALFLDDWDIFHLVKQNVKLQELDEQRDSTKVKLIQAQTTLKKLQSPIGLEAFAREEKFFKKNDEDIFVISYE